MTDIQKVIAALSKENDTKIVLMVADGLGGLPMEPGGPTELEAAKTPNLDRLAQKGVCGSMTMVFPGITPGSGPGHLALFGYDPLVYQIGRGALEATGIGFPLQPGDVAIRCNFCTLQDGIVVDRRAGRIPTEESSQIVEELKQIKLDEAEVFVEPVKEHRFVLVFRGEGLGDGVHDTDPGVTGQAPLEPTPKEDTAENRKTARLAKQFLEKAAPILAKQPKANWALLRGFSHPPNLPSYQEVYKLRAAAISVYPMYKGLASLAGMKLVGNATNLQEQIDVLKQAWNDFDFFFVHFKYTDSRGEDGNFDAKVAAIEEFDSVIPEVEALKPDVLIVTGDHSTPCKLRSHSWHPVPVVLVADSCRPDACQAFNETEVLKGGLGQFDAKFLMSLALAHAGRLDKFGA